MPFIANTSRLCFLQGPFLGEVSSPGEGLADPPTLSILHLGVQSFCLRMPPELSLSPGQAQWVALVGPAHLLALQGSLLHWDVAAEHSVLGAQRTVWQQCSLQGALRLFAAYASLMTYLYSEMLLLLWWARLCSSPPQEGKTADESNCNGGEGAGGIWGSSLNLELIQHSVVNTTIFARNALGLQATTYLYDRWNCLLPPLLFSQPVGYSAFTGFLCYSSPMSQGWFRAAPSKGCHVDSSAYFSD